jgi:hypothetical protein
VAGCAGGEFLGEIAQYGFTVVNRKRPANQPLRE